MWIREQWALSLFSCPIAVLLLEECEVELITLLHRGRVSCIRCIVQKWIMLVHCLHNSWLVQYIHVLILSEKQKFCPRRRDASSVMLVWCVENTGLLAEKCISLVLHILNNFRSCSTIFDSEWIIGGAGQGPAHMPNTMIALLLLMKLCNTIVFIRAISFKIGNYVISEIPAIISTTMDII